MASSLSIARPRVPFAFTTRAFNFEREENVPFELASFSLPLSSSTFFRPIKRMEGGGKSVRRVLSIVREFSTRGRRKIKLALLPFATNENDCSKWENFKWCAIGHVFVVSQESWN